MIIDEDAFYRFVNLVNSIDLDSLPTEFTETKHVPMLVNTDQIYQVICDQVMSRPEDLDITILSVDTHLRTFELRVEHQKGRFNFKKSLSEHEILSHEPFVIWDEYPYRYAQSSTREMLGEFVDISTLT